jgi:acetyl esterase/lipase
VASLSVLGCGGGSTDSVSAASTTSPVVPATSPTTTSPTTTSTVLVVPTVEPETDAEHTTYRYGPAPEHLFDLHEPVGGRVTSEQRPALVYLHSGGWVAGSRSNLADFVSAQRERGWYVVAVDYRLAPADPFPAAHEDVDRVLRWLGRYGPWLGVDPGALVVIGTSAGGDLALAAGAAPGRFVAGALEEPPPGPLPAVAGVVSVSGPSDLAALYAQPVGYGHPTVGAYLGCGDECTEERLRAASVISMVAADPAPALLLFGALDTLVPADVHGFPLAARWEEAGGSATVWVAADHGHNLALGQGIDPVAFAAWLDAAVDAR